MKNEVAALNATQVEMSATQDKNWLFIQRHLSVHEENFQIVRDLDQLLFANQQSNFNFDTVFSLLAMIHAGVKRY